jgi:hypothetical protein
MWGATGVTIGGVPAPSFKYIDAGTLEIISPAGTAGWQELRVILANGSAPAAFKYEQAQTSLPTTSPTSPAVSSTYQPGLSSAAPTKVTARSNTPTVKAGQRVTLSVVVIAGGTPVVGAKVSLRGNGRTLNAVTDSAGRAVFKVTARTTTRYTVSVAATLTSSASRSTAMLKVRAAKRST